MTAPEGQGYGSGIAGYETQDKGQGEQREKDEDSDDKYERNPVGYLMFAVLLFWVGIFFLLRNRHMIPETGRGWAVLVFGAAAISLLNIVTRLFIPRFRPEITGVFVLMTIWAGLGIGLWTGGAWEIIGPVVLIVVAIALVVGRLLPRR